MKCYTASFNVGNVEVWSSELYLDKNSVSLEIENSKENIIEFLDDNSVFLEKGETAELLENAISDLKKYGTYKSKDNNFDFFILEKIIWKNYEQKNK